MFKSHGLELHRLPLPRPASRAKNLLLNPNQRIGEVAFAAAISILSHFNRVFRRIAGRIPTRFREKLPSS